MHSTVQAAKTTPQARTKDCSQISWSCAAHHPELIAGSINFPFLFTAQRVDPRPHWCRPEVFESNVPPSKRAMVSAPTCAWRAKAQARFPRPGCGEKSSGDFGIIPTSYQVLRNRLEEGGVSDTNSRQSPEDVLDFLFQTHLVVAALTRWQQGCIERVLKFGYHIRGRKRTKGVA
jgi:hypothetical protein